MPPKVMAKNNDRPSGVLPVNGAARAAASKRPQPRLKLEVRRLPPGLTLTEFEEALGEDWRLGSGKVDWREYRQGKVTHAQGKVPVQSRCYIHLMNEPLVKEFEACFMAATFHDKAGTHKSPDLKHLPPTLGFAPNQRTPINAKPRADNRQGTIDQDAEFIAFLEGETKPITKSAALDSVSGEHKEPEKVEVRSTPLIEALREKKANKARVAETKAAEKKETKGHARADSKDASPISKKDAKDDKPSQKHKLEQASKEAVKALNKQVANNKQQQARPASPQQPQTKNSTPSTSKKLPQSPKPQNAAPTQPGKEAAKTTKVAASAAPGSTASNPATPAKERTQRQRGNAEGIKKMLQKDLGIKPKAAAASQSNAPTQPKQSTLASASPKPTPSSQITKDQRSKTISSPAPPSTKAQNPPTAPKQQAQNAFTQSVTKVYLKHANPSQGMTEMLIQQALSQYGEVTNVTIDPRKGTAIAIFKDVDGMNKAIEAKRVTVANGNVEVMEFKDRSAAGGRGGFRGGRGGVRGGRGGGSSAPPTPPTVSTPAAPKADAGP